MRVLVRPGIRPIGGPGIVRHDGRVQRTAPSPQGSSVSPAVWPASSSRRLAICGTTAQDRQSQANKPENPGQIGLGRTANRGDFGEDDAILNSVLVWRGRAADVGATLRRYGPTSPRVYGRHAARDTLCESRTRGRAGSAGLGRYGQDDGVAHRAGRQRPRLRPVCLPVHRLFSRHRDYPPRISSVEPAAERLRRPHQGG